MKKIFTIVGSLVAFSVLITFVLWMEEDQGLIDLADRIKKAKEMDAKGPPMELEKLANLKTNEFPKYDNRVVIGLNFKPLRVLPTKITFLNIADKNWDKKTISYLNESSDYDRKINIIKKEGLISLNNGEGIHLERANISFTQRDGTRGDFDALVNSETGTIEIVLSKNINEDIDEPEPVRKNPEAEINPFANTASAEEVKELEEGNVENILENLNQERLADFDPEQYQEEIQESEIKLKEQNSDANFSKYVKELKREISSEK